MPEPLVDLERRVLDYLVRYLRANTYQPSIREIGREFSIKSTKTVSELLQSLADKGWIERDPSRSRGVRLLGVALDAETVTVPWLDALEPPLALDRRLAGGAAAMVAVAPDETLAPLGVRRGDLLLLEPVTAAELADGDLVYATQGGAPLLRRAVRRPGGLALESGGPGAALTVAIGGALDLKGRVRTVLRRIRAEPAPVTVPLAT